MAQMLLKYSITLEQYEAALNWQMSQCMFVIYTSLHISLLFIGNLTEKQLLLKESLPLIAPLHPKEPCLMNKLCTNHVNIKE